VGSRNRHVPCKIINGLIDGLEYLHTQGIVHQDIRPSNLILDYKNNVVIIDYETAGIHGISDSVEYLGGYICWPKRLLESNTIHYTSEPADDLFASILVILHLIFPS
jgi:serine/threonine protein kinase